jgi:vancomycin resistance protein YoaR
LILPDITGKKQWWEAALRSFEPTIPQELRKDLDIVFALKGNRTEEEALNDHKKLKSSKSFSNVKRTETSYFISPDRQGENVSVAVPDLDYF